MSRCLTVTASLPPAANSGTYRATGASTSAEVAAHLGWTRHEHPLADLDTFSRGLAVMETKAHLELLVARGEITRSVAPDGVVSFAAASPTAR